MVFEELALFFSSLVSDFGLLGLFLVSFIANTTIFIIIPFEFIVIAVSASGVFPFWIIGLVVGFGAALGEFVSYFVGFGGKKVAEKIFHPKDGKIHEIVKQIENKGMLVIGFFAFLPLIPFDLVALAAGYLKYDLKKFFFATLIGKIMRYSIVAYAGFIGVEILRGIFF